MTTTPPHRAATGGAFARWLPSALPFLLLVAAWWPSRGAAFGVIDDHQIVAMLDGRDRLPLRRVLPELYGHRTEALGRFRPLYWFGQVIESATAGDSALWWYLDRLALAAITLAALLYVCRQFVGPWTAALVSPTVLLGPQFEAWSRLGAAEAYAMPLLAVGLAGLVKALRQDEASPLLWGAAAVVASGLAKENFLPLAVGTVAWVGFGCRHRLTPRGRWLVAAVAVVVVADALILVHQVHSYGSQYGEDRSPSTALSWAAYAAGNAAAFQALPAALLLLVVRNRHRLRRDLVALAVLAGAAAIEFGFYAGADHAGRYLLPTTACTLGVWLVGLRPSVDRTPRAGTLRIVAGSTLAVSLVLGCALANRIAAGNAEATGRFQDRLHATEAVIRAQQVRTVVLEPGDPYLDAELVLSVARYLRSDMDVTVMTTPSRAQSTSARDLSIAASLAQMSAHGSPDGLISPYAREPGCLSLTFSAEPPVCALARPAPR